MLVKTKLQGFEPQGPPAAAQQTGVRSEFHNVLHRELYTGARIALQCMHVSLPPIEKFPVVFKSNLKNLLLVLEIIWKSEKASWKSASPAFSESSAIKWKQAGKTFALPVLLDASRVHNVFFLLANFTIGAQCVENLLPRKSLISEIEPHGDASHILSFEI